MAQMNAFSETFPTAFLIHERKFEATHISFFTAIRNYFLHLSLQSLSPMVKTVINIIPLRNIFPSWIVVSCILHNVQLLSHCRPTSFH